MTPIESLSVSISCRHLRAVPPRDTARVVVWLRGEHDLSTVPELSAALAQAITLDDADVLVDLRDVQFMGAATVDVLCRAADLLEARSRRLVLRSSPSCVRRVLRVLELFGEEDLIAPVEAGPAASIDRLAHVTSIAADRLGREASATLMAGRGMP